MELMTLKINCDGGSRGNPGPAAIGVVIESSIKNQVSRIEKISKYIEIATNNQAEYRAVLEALKWIEENIKSDFSADFILDSELVVKQLNGEYKIKNEGLKPLFNEIKSLIIKLGGRINFRHVKREENKEADRLVNKALDNR